MNQIHTLTDDPVVAYAAAELSRCLRKMTGIYSRVRLAPAHRPGAPGFWLGTCEAIPGCGLAPSRWDDAYALKGGDGHWTIAGSNPRSVLFGVYAWLERHGARWVRPGKRGEILPRLEQLPAGPLDVVERASYRHRGICIEGATSIRHVLDLVDWMAKRRMNTFYLQFRHAGTFWDRWYGREYNPYFGTPRHLTDEECFALDDQVIAAAHRRGMVMHRVGHGWTAAAVGLRPFGWHKTDAPVAPDKQRWLAELNGQRGLHQGIPINTELCYSHGPAFEALIEELAGYARAHPEIEVLHFWLSDAPNNKCECPDCAPLTPPDWYARLVNALSERLHQVDPERRFVFLSYFESWWPPEREMLTSERGNAVFMFAPITRCFRHALTDPECATDFPLDRPALNRVGMPRGNQAFLHFLSQWRQAFAGDSFVYDYHLIWAVFEQLTDTAIGRVLHQDMRDLGGLGLNGMVSCQVMRCFWPTGLAMAALADTLWDAGADWGALRDRHFAAAYGHGAALVTAYLDGLDALLFSGPPHERGPILSAERLDQARAVRDHVHRHHSKLARLSRNAPDEVQRQSFKLLLHHNRLVDEYCGALLGEIDPQALRTWLLRSERRIHPYLDVSFLLGRHPLLAPAS
jgi:hypothetical protein